MLKLIIAIVYIIGSIAFGGYIIYLFRADEDGIELYGEVRDAAIKVFDGNRNIVMALICAAIMICSLAWPIMALVCGYVYIVS